MSVAVGGDERMGLRQHGNIVLAFSADVFEGECHVGHKVGARLVRFRYHQAGTAELVRFRMRMRNLHGMWIPRRSVSGEAMRPTRIRRSDLRVLDRCLRWLGPANPALRGIRPLLSG
ncbi:MAG: hypothetical protein R2720_12890 [Candidatus Nanopelagicales bacterium]